MVVMSQPHVTILGSRVSRTDVQHAVGSIEEWIRHPRVPGRFVVATGFHGIWVAHRDPAFRAIVNASDLFCPDGMAPVWLSRLRGDPLPGRVPGPDILQSFLEVANGRGYSSYFYGDTEDTLSALVDHVSVKYPGHRVAGAFSPPFRGLSPEEDREAVDRINAARPDVLWVGLGLPKQERWYFARREQLNVPVVVNVGAAFRFVSGRVRRAPSLIGNAGLEWAWRFACEPRKLWRRDLVEAPQFLYHALKETWEIRRGRAASQR